eukprot:tig00000093_g3626.t1
MQVWASGGSSREEAARNRDFCIVACQELDLLAGTPPETHIPDDALSYPRSEYESEPFVAAIRRGELQLPSAASGAPWDIAAAIQNIRAFVAEFGAAHEQPDTRTRNEDYIKDEPEADEEEGVNGDEMQMPTAASKGSTRTRACKAQKKAPTNESTSDEEDEDPEEDDDDDDEDEEYTEGSGGEEEEEEEECEEEEEEEQEGGEGPDDEAEEGEEELEGEAAPSEPRRAGGAGFLRSVYRSLNGKKFFGKFTWHRTHARYYFAPFLA